MIAAASGMRCISQTIALSPRERPQSPRLHLRRGSRVTPSPPGNSPKRARTVCLSELALLHWCAPSAARDWAPLGTKSPRCLSDGRLAPQKVDESYLVEVFSLMEVIRALSNPEVAVRIDAAIEALDRLPASRPEKAVPREPIRLGHRALRREILAVLGDAHVALRPIEVRQRVERRLGRCLDPHGIVASLSSGAKSPKVPIVRVECGRYRLAS